MTNPRSPFVNGALDLGALKERAEHREDSAPAVASFVEVTPENFEAEVVRRSAQVPVVVLIGSPRSPASEQLKADFSALAAKGNHSFIVAYVDADAVPQVAQVFGVRNLPTTVALAAGQPVTNFEGGQPVEALEQWTQALVAKLGPQLKGLPQESSQEEAPEEADPRLVAAEDELNRGDVGAAIASYDKILAAEPSNGEVKKARAMAVVLKRLAAGSNGADPIAAADSDQADTEKQLLAADAEVAAGVAEKAFSRLIGAISRSAGAEKQALKERLLELFTLFEGSDPRVLQARTDLASALY
ncbi:tetratricopeptide repeat protein [Corynebacterium flavescens]|uniref:Thioredoxin n=2 Tax=Corynebacterium flavescens TaxID=28028 RepID=A0A1L7CLB3_CORFL|nr:tetratricopeptide repeat protein [Corynebacterium flavescens]APT86634.1 thioredoxin [Corynebacterium flavescens]KAA8722800.1 tetratricopeptide repeat protein [Corynebacterium flavescens]GEB96603.1 thioredoxin [Corynebacterium flavescens]HCG47101.1 co-chaperone YbbN [Corynebacterium flavescens]